MSAGAIRAAIVCDVGAHSISPITKSTITRAIVGTLELSGRRRNGKPMSGIATRSFTAAETGATSRVTRIWKSVTRTGLITRTNPQVEGESPYVCTAEIGSAVSIAK